MIPNFVILRTAKNLALGILESPVASLRVTELWAIDLVR